MSSKISLFLFFTSLSLLVGAISPEEDEKKGKNEISITFELNDPDIVLPLENDVKDFIAKCNSSENIPTTKLSKSGFKFSGWTPDGVRGYARGDIFRTGCEDMTFKPVFVDSSDDVRYTVTYYAEYEGEVIDISELLPKEKYRKNSLVEVDNLSLPNEKAKQRGWGFDGYEFIQYQKFIMPAKNVVLTALWHKYYKLTYYAGDVEGIVGATKAEFELREGGTKELADSSRLSRKGYTLTGWHCTYDDKDYKFLYSYVMPDSDVDFYAIWEPIEYKVTFIPGVSGVASTKIPGKTGTKITIPEINCENEGYIFGGWKYNNKVYMPGEEFLIEGLMPGVGYGFKAVWTKEE